VHTPTIDELWSTPPATNRFFDPNAFSSLPEPAQRYLCHAIAPGTPLASAVKMTSHGEIKLKGWSPFTAEQVNRIDGRLLWTATIRQSGMPITGFDSLIGGEARMNWRLFGFIPIANADGDDVTQSGIGRYQGEAVWLPSLLCDSSVTWESSGPNQVTANLSTLGRNTRLSLTIDGDGRLEQLAFLRWGNPNGSDFHNEDYGAVIEEERTFGGYTVPSKLTVGWYFGTGRFKSEGEYFRATIDSAQFR
jgi:hypothetical protein